MPNVGARVLIIDYEPRGIKQLSDPLEGAGFEVCVAKDGVAGIQAFRDQKPDLVVVEAMLPKRHGFEVCQEIKRTELGRDVPVIVVTSVYKGRKYRSQAIHQHGADEYMEKPVPGDRLLETVKRLLPGVRVVPGSARPAAPEATSAVPEPAKSAGAPAAAASRTPPAPAAPRAQAAPPPAPKPATVAATPKDSAEAEIVDRLNEIFGEPGGGGSGPGR